METLNRLKHANEKIEEMESLISNLKLEIKNLTDKNQKADTIIVQLSLQLDEFSKIRPIIDEFLKAYPDQRPENIIKDVKDKREGVFQNMEHQKDLNAKIILLQNEKQELIFRSRGLVDDFSRKLREQELDVKDRIQKLNDNIYFLNCELIEYRGYKEEHKKLISSLFAIYNLLIARFSVERGLKLNNLLPVEEKDFKCDVFNNEEIASYIQIMITLSSEHKSVDDLREVIAYSNMFLRIYSTENVHLKFKPVQCFKAIKDIIEKLTLEQMQLKENKSVLEGKVEKLESENDKLKKEVKHSVDSSTLWEKKYRESIVFSGRDLYKNENRRSTMRSSQKFNSISAAKSISKFENDEGTTIGLPYPIKQNIKEPKLSSEVAETTVLKKSKSETRINLQRRPAAFVCEKVKKDSKVKFILYILKGNIRDK